MAMNPLDDPRLPEALDRLLVVLGFGALYQIRLALPERDRERLAGLPVHNREGSSEALPRLGDGQNIVVPQLQSFLGSSGLSSFATMAV